MGLEWLVILGLGLLGGTVGALGRSDALKQEQKRIQDQKQSAWDAYLLGQAHSDEQFGIQKGEALYQLGVQENQLHQGVNRNMDEYNTMMLSRAFGEQDARIQNESGIGGYNAAVAAGGTRGNAANDLVTGYARQGLERNLDLQGRQDSLALSGMLTQANNAMGAIGHEYDSWGPGGWRTRSKDAQDAYNLGIAKLGEKDFDRAYEYADPNNWEANGWSYVTDFFSGGASGVNMGANLYRFGTDYWGWGRDGKSIA
jgi:hypothetical protein